MAFRHQDYFASSCRLLSLFYSIFTSIPHDSLFVWAQCTWLQSHRKPYYRLTLSLAGRYCLGSLFLSCCCHQPGNTITMRSDGFALSTWYHFGCKICTIFVRRNVSSFAFFHCDCFSHCVITYRIWLLLQCRFWALGVVDHWHIVPIYVCRSLQRYSHHP